LCEQRCAQLLFLSFRLRRRLLGRLCGLLLGQLCRLRLCRGLRFRRCLCGLRLRLRCLSLCLRRGRLRRVALGLRLLEFGLLLCRGRRVGCRLGSRYARCRSGLLGRLLLGDFGLNRDATRIRRVLHRVARILLDNLSIAVVRLKLLRICQRSLGFVQRVRRVFLRARVDRDLHRIFRLEKFQRRFGVQVRARRIA
jgi:hypothetical protein